MKYIIMCGGTYAGWDSPRQLIKIRGEPIVARTIRLLKESGVTDIYISTNDTRFAEFGVPILRHKNDFKGFSNHGGCWAEAFYPTDEPCCYIFGDVVFSPGAIYKIVNDQTADIQFYASAPPFAVSYVKKYAEPFAFKVFDQRRFRAAVDFVIANETSGIFKRRPIAWELWQVLNGEDVNQINYRNYCRINDYTCDIDSKADVQKLEAVIR